MSRDLNEEFSDNDERKYAYDFDWTIRDRLLKRISKNLNTSGKTLEIGAYLGDMTHQILAEFTNLTVLEGSKELCRHLRNRFGSRISLVESAIEDAEFSTRFDSIFLIHTLEHLDNPVDCLKKIGGWLNDDGRLIIAVPNGEALSRQIAVKMGLIESNCAVTDGEYNHGHRRTYNMDLLQSHVKLAGLEIVELGGVIVKPFSNAQFDQALSSQIISQEYVYACDLLARELPHLSASIFIIAETRN